MHNKIYWGWLVALLLSAELQAEPSSDVQLAFNQVPVLEGLADNGSLAHMDCIFAALGLTYKAQPMPWRRARQEVVKGTLDGYFTALPQRNIDRYAQLSRPLVLENWYWFWRADKTEPEDWRADDIRLGAILGSHQADLLTDEGYSLYQQVTGLPQLARLLASGRIDGFLADKEHLEEVVAELAMDINDYAHSFFRYVPLGVYFGNHFLTGHPGFLDSFNQAIYGCAPEGFQLSPYERERVLVQVMPKLRAWRYLPELQEAVQAQNRRHQGITQAEISARDNQWIVEFQRGTREFSASVLTNALSQTLRSLQYATDGLITEVIVMDEHGLNVGVSKMTSDYWQGNEEKYQLTFGYPPNTVFVDDVRYDESTGRFQVQVNIPLYDPDEETPIGAITVGVDIEQALRNGSGND